MVILGFRPELLYSLFCLLCYASVLNKELIVPDKNSYYAQNLTNYAHQNSYSKKEYSTVRLY